MPIPSIRFAFLGAAISLLAIGCGADGEKGTKFTCSVVKGGKPVEGVTVGFSPSDLKERSATATKTSADGHFEVYVKPGKYVVTLTRMVDKKGNIPKESENPAEDLTQLEASGYLRNSLPEKFSDPNLSPLGVEISTEAKELPPFDVAKSISSQRP